MENQLVRTDKLLYKIKRFFMNVFLKNNSQKINEDTIENVSDIPLELDKVVSCKTEVDELRIKEQLAQKLIKTELSINDLTDEEIEQMIEYFQKDIKLKAEELTMLKKQITALKKEYKKIEAEKNKSC